MRILLITLGSHGDVHPFVGLGLALRDRGHAVTLMTSGYFEELIVKTGLDFQPFGTREEFEKNFDNPDLWHPRKSMSVISESIARYLPKMYERVAAYVKEYPDTIMVGSTLAFAARLVQEKIGTPLITVHLSPSCIRSLNDTMKIPGIPFSKNSPHWLKRAFFWLADRAVLDRHLGRAINPFRQQIGLKPVKHIVRDWWHSPQKVIGLWPELFAPPQIDWPPNTVLTGFPLWDEAGVTPMSDAMEQFLAAGPLPVAFTPGSAMTHGHEFFQRAVRACNLSNMRGILLTRHSRHIPANLPPTIAHFDYAPFSQLLPRCAALVHHGGIGTTAQALSTATPQIVLPFSFDQFDNAERSRRLGSAEILSSQNSSPSLLAAALLRAQAQNSSGNLAGIAGKIRLTNGLAETCNQIEVFAGAVCAYH